MKFVSAALISLAALVSLVGCSAAPAADPPVPARWGLATDASSSFSIEPNGVAALVEFPVSEQGPACNGAGERHVTGSARWWIDAGGTLRLAVDGVALPVVSSSERGYADWEEVFISLCGDDFSDEAWLTFYGGAAAAVKPTP